MAYVAITNTEIDANSPLIFTIGRRLRDNPEEIAAGTAAIKYKIPLAFCSTGSGMFRNSAHRTPSHPTASEREVVVSPYGAGFPPIFYSASGFYTVPRGVYKLNVELWGAGASYDSAASGFTPCAGSWVQAYLNVTPGHILSIGIGQPVALSVGQSSTISTTAPQAISTLVLAPGGEYGASPTVPTGAYSSDQSGSQSGGYQRIVGSGTNGSKIYGGGPFVSASSALGAQGFCILKAVP